MSWLRWFWKFLRPGIVERELDDEVRFHLERQVEINIASGMTPEEARYSALRRFGGVDVVKEQCRDERPFAFLYLISQDLRLGIRFLRRNPGFAAVAVLSLAIAIGINTAMFSIVDALLLRDLPYRNPDRLVSIFGQAPGLMREEAGLSTAEFLRIRETC